MKITLGFSTCPNDTFIFDALVHHKIDTEGLEFEVLLSDVEDLNKLAFQQKLDVTKLSFHAYIYLTEYYRILDAGSALGFNNGPLLISDKKRDLKEIANLKIAKPGKFTTANLLLSIAFPEAKNRVEMLFSEIEDAILSGKVEAGIIIHENRFTYHTKGLVKLMDLGEYWQNLTQKPIPLGCIVVNRRLSDEIQLKINRILKRSVAFAFENPESSISFIKQHAQEMEPEVIKKHIDLYVNEFSQDLGTYGKQAILTLFEHAQKKGVIPTCDLNIFL
jgi:1,4-dihydroxy-6-naphthoate synthase